MHAAYIKGVDHRGGCLQAACTTAADPVAARRWESDSNQGSRWRRMEQRMENIEMFAVKVDEIGRTVDIDQGSAKQLIILDILLLRFGYSIYFIFSFCKIPPFLLVKN